MGTNIWTATTLRASCVRPTQKYRQQLLPEWRLEKPGRILCEYPWLHRVRVRVWALRVLVFECWGATGNNTLNIIPIALLRQLPMLVNCVQYKMDVSMMYQQQFQSDELVWLGWQKQIITYLNAWLRQDPNRGASCLSYRGSIPIPKQWESPVRWLDQSTDACGSLNPIISINAHAVVRSA